MKKRGIDMRIAEAVDRPTVPSFRLTVADPPPGVARDRRAVAGFRLTLARVRQSVAGCPHLPANLRLRLADCRERFPAVRQPWRRPGQPWPDSRSLQPDLGNSLPDLGDPLPKTGDPSRPSASVGRRSASLGRTSAKPREQLSRFEPSTPGIGIRAAVRGWRRALIRVSPGIDARSGLLPDRLEGGRTGAEDHGNQQSDSEHGGALLRGKGLAPGSLPGAASPRLARVTPGRSRLPRFQVCYSFEETQS